MPGYLLDTCAWIDSLLAPEKLSQPIRRIIGSKTPLHLCSVSLLEFARKEARGEQCTSSRGNKESGQHHWLELDNNPKPEYLASFEVPKIVMPAIERAATFVVDR